MNTEKGKQIVYTLSAKCRDCYRCLRVCPVKAIGIKDGQAYVDESRCILCGTCVRECPQHAKVYRNDVDRVRELIEKNETVIASIAPSFSAVYSGWKSNRLPSALRMLGFSKISETSEGAYQVAAASCEQNEKNREQCVATACPVVVNYIEKYKSELIDKLVPVVSPMIAHAKMLKKRYGNKAKVVFIGPCIAKKHEAERSEYEGIVDAVLTFTELSEWLDEENICLSNCEENYFDNEKYLGEAKLFALPGGMLKTAGLKNDGTDARTFHSSGSKEIMDLFESFLRKRQFDIIEPLFCEGGCINGPGLCTDKSIFERRNDLIEYANSKKIYNKGVNKDSCSIDFKTDFVGNTNLDTEVISEEDIQKVLQSTGKADPEMQLNCGACGYKSCYDQAKAVLMGMAEREMCIPYMRRLAEQRVDKIIETSPNGIVILNEELQIISMNPAFKKYFMCSDNILKRRISYLFDVYGYEKVSAGAIEKYESIMEYNGSQYHNLIYPLSDDKQYVGIYVDITGIKLNEDRLNLVRQKTISEAQDLLEHQIMMAQKIANYLGESTAKSEKIVGRLMDIHDNK